MLALTILTLTGAAAASASTGGSSAPGGSSSKTGPARKPAARKRSSKRRRHHHPVLSHQQRLENLNSQRATATYQVMQSKYYDASNNSYYGTFAWPYSQAMGATISVASLPNMHHQLRTDLVARLTGLEVYADHADPPPAGYLSEPGNDSTTAARFNDDNEWIGIELLRLYHLDHQQGLISAAGDLMQMVWSQWQGSDTTCPGGVPWERLTDNGDRNTVSNATGAELGAQLYLYTGNQAYLNEAIQMYNWVRSCLMNPDGLYADHITGGGDIDDTEWTYNQGEMIGAGVMLTKATGNAGYENQAIATAQTAMSAFGPAQLAAQPTTFDAIYMRNLLLLGGMTGDPRYASFVQWFADDAWDNVRDPNSGLFLSGPGGTTTLLDQASMAQLYALLAEPPSLT